MLEVTLKKFTLVQGGKEKPIGTSIFDGAAVAILESLLQHGSKGCSYGSGPNTFGGCTRLRKRSGISDTLPPRCSKCCCCSIFFSKSKMEKAHWSAAGLPFSLRCWEHNSGEARLSLSPWAEWGEMRRGNSMVEETRHFQYNGVMEHKTFVLFQKTESEGTTLEHNK